MSETAIKIENLKKQYRLGAIGGQTLNAELQSWWARMRGKEDPNLKIGQDYSNYGERFYALNGINLEIKKGEALGIIGGNGAGKSTLLKILSRVTAPTEGDVWINGRIASMLEVGTGFHGELTGRENIYMNGAILGMSRKEVDKKIESIIDFSECRQFIDTPVKRYSSGMYVKLAFAVASHLDAEIMVMDEVLAVGDMKFQKKCLGKMGAEAADGKTVLYVSHNMSTIRELCNRCVVLSKGNIIFDGDVENAIDVYMDEDKADLKVEYSFDNKKRSDPIRGTKVFIHALRIIGKDSATFLSSEKMKFQIDVEGKERVDNLRIRLEIRTPDGANVGMSESGIMFNIDKNERKKMNYSFDLCNLAEGVYTLRLTIFLLNEMGGHDGLDEVTEPIYFEIVENGIDCTKWMPQYWGRIKLPPVEKC
ncbi:ABC transporter ATP-binding protein [Butyrivibrio sp. INlla16]|uniref:ABC transporter ATP-binding protein n=1 Tax=Butyrivibrio sp. INlla16 TaxID=1520807 RepID=UPI00088B14A8|nr:ABC transporter ATP-binding protein [Butyrivibrio sp. INlla16]SDB68215.1 lipopolysaccharide transport system ATP-binding protein [Butyrivibrio sp. INlla16]